MSLRRRTIQALTALPVALALPLAVTGEANAAPTARAAAVAACPGSTAAPARPTVGAVSNATLCLINRERARRGVRKLRPNGRLSTSAARYSRDMARRDFFAHVSPGGTTMLGRIKAAGYLHGTRGYTVGENLAWGSGGFATPVETVANWMKSPGHRANILSGRFREVGVGVAVGAPVRSGTGGFDAATYTTHFGARS